ncbi:hypothetical protein K457DRAFT_822465 [Linnemannia elongata AG-77]|uniref:RNI-like protein n=1 Tax=Linnemannia elongata AG-77 TaxID=1314771 RepID=A0A197K9V8_9FUNG|nr:hypothetical protein K457DRAFT_822465 [Linnemannia elongata AG-77]
MLWPTDPSSTLSNKAAAVDRRNPLDPLDPDINSSNTDQASSPFLNTFDNSRPSSPAPPVAQPTLSSSPARVQSPKINLDLFHSGENPIPPSLRTPPESPIKGLRRTSFKRPTLPPLQQHPFETELGQVPSLSSPPTSPTALTPATNLPPKLWQSLAEHPLFKNSTPEGIQQLASSMHIRHYHPQDHIIRRSDQSSAMFYVLRGTVKVVSHDNEATYYEIKENNFFGDIGVLYRVPRSMDVLAKNRCTIAILSGEDLVKVMESCPETAKAIGYQTQERYQMYLKRRQSISARCTLDGGSGGPDQGRDDANSDSFAKSDIHSAIRKVPLFQSCSSEVIHMLSLKVEPRTYNLGQTIIRRGEIGREMFFVTSGMVEILSDDNLHVLARFRDGQFFGEIAVLLDVPRIANVKAVSQVEVFVLTKENLEAVFKAVPGAAETITAEGNRLYNNWLIHNSRTNAERGMHDSIGPMDIDGELNHQSLNVPRDAAQSPVQKLPTQNIQPQDTSVPGQTGFTADLSNPPTRRSSQDPIHPIEAGHPAAISVLPMTTNGEIPRGRRLSIAQSLAPLSITQWSPFDEAPMATPMPPPAAQEQPYFEQNAILPAHESGLEPPVSRNPTIRGLVESNPKRRRASVAVWTQQDLMKLAETAQAKTMVDTTFAPATSSAMATAEPSLPDQEAAGEGAAQDEHDMTAGIASVALTEPIKLRTGPATFQDLGEAIVLNILKGLPITALLRARRVCKDWDHKIMEHNDLVRDLDLSMHKKIVTDAVLSDLCNSILSRNPARTTRVSLRDCFLISDKGLSMLASHMPAVQALDLHSCWNVTDAGFRSLGMYCPKLRSIDFSNCRKLGDETIYGLYPRSALIANGVPQEAVAPQPATKSRSSPVISPDLPGCPLISHLNLSYCKNITDRSFIHLCSSGSRQLEYLNLQRCTTISPEAFISLSLDTFDSEPASDITNGHIPELVPIPGKEACFPKLKELYLSDCTFLTDEAIVALSPNMPRLESISLSFCCALTDIALEALSDSCVFLKKIDLSFCGSAVSDASLYQLAQFDALNPGRHMLEDLEIRGCVRVTEQGVREILNGCSSLKRLNISCCAGIGSGDLSDEALVQAVSPPAPAPLEPQVPAPQAPTQQDQGQAGAVAAALHPLDSAVIELPPQPEVQQADPVAPQASKVVIAEAVAPQEVAPLESSSPEPTNTASCGSLAARHNVSQAGEELSKKMDALKRGKEWALAQQRPGLVIIV